MPEECNDCGKRAWVATYQYIETRVAPIKRNGDIDYSQSELMSDDHDNFDYYCREHAPAT